MGVFELGGNDAFWKFSASAFGNQASLSPERYEEWATDAGVTDLATLRAGLASGRWTDPVDADLRDGKSLGVSGTPTFFINGHSVDGAQPLEKFTAVIDQELQEAQAKIDKGTPRERVYAEMARENREHGPKPPPPPEEDTKTIFKIPLGSGPALGVPTALVTIVEFGDFQCPFCRRAEPTLAAVRAKYGDKVRLVWRNNPLPFHPNAEPAAQAALEVRAERGDAAFWEMHDKIFESQADLSPDSLTALATQVGANATKVRAAIGSHAHAKLLMADSDVADDFQANGTPHFFINGRRLVGAQPEARFDAIIDEEITRAETLVAAGTAPADLYAALTKDGKDGSAFEMKDVPTALPATDPTRGNPTAKVVVHEWCDFQDPFAKRAEPALAELMKNYGTKIKFVWHDLPQSFHERAAPAAEAAREAYREKGAPAFWEMHDKIFGGAPYRLERDDFDGYARSMKLDMHKWAAALDGTTAAADITADSNAAASVKITATPSFLIVPSGSAHGYFVLGSQPYSKFRRVVERALAEAK